MRALVATPPGGGALAAPELERVRAPIPSAAPPRRRASDPRAPLFAGALLAILCVLWIFAANRDGSWRQVPFWDIAWFHTQALQTLHGLQDGGLPGLADAWAHASSTHTPLVPTISALFMAVLGPTRAAAELVLPLCTFVLLLSTFRVAERLFDRKTAYAAAALVATFPVVLTYSRLYFFEIALAATFAASCWALLASEGFTRWKPTIAFGVLAGLVALSRAMGFVFLAGPVLVALASIARRPALGGRILRFGVASAIGAALAATWYIPNFSELFGYIFRFTYGPEARAFSGSESAFCLANFLYYAEWLVLDGPGVPMLAIALLAFAWARVARRGAGARAARWISPPVAILLMVCAVDFFAALAGSQRMAGKFLLPIMPAVAILVVRCVAAIPLPRARALAGAAVGLLGIHHLVACTFLFSVDPNTPSNNIQGSPPGAHIASLANHNDFYLDWSKQGGGNALVDYKIGETIDRLESFATTRDGAVGMWGEHVFFDGGPLQLEALRRRDGIHFWNPPGMRVAMQPGWLDEMQTALANCSVVLHRETGDATSKAYGELLRSLNDGIHFKFVKQEEPVALGDGSKVWIYCRPPRFVAELKKN